MNKHFFITGTDTNAGKTLVTAALLRAARQQGHNTLGLKPVAAGCEPDGQGQLRNADALALQAESTEAVPYEIINPVTLAPPIAPHIAAEKLGIVLKADDLLAHIQSQLKPDTFTLVEGAGGWRVPLNDRETLADLAKGLELPVVLLVGMKLGCISHALLTQEAILADGLKIAGWVASQTDPEMSVVEENFASLKARIHAPCLGFIPYCSKISPKIAASFLDIGKLLG